MAGLFNSLVCLFLIFHSTCLGFKSPLSVFKRYQENSWPPLNDCPKNRQTIISPDSTDFTLDIQMPGVTPRNSDTYFCMPVRVPTDEEAYVVDFKPRANMDTVHHMLLFGCKMPFSNENYWNCGTAKGTCRDEASIMYAWARNAPPTKLPKNVGFRIGGDTGIRYFVLQVHYGDINAFRDKHRDCSGVALRMTHEQQPLIAGIYLLMSIDTVIQPGKKVVDADIACAYKKYPMFPFAYRVHTHHLGQVVSGYRVRNGKWTLIGRQSPQLPQAFYPANNPMEVKFGDILAARCVFTGEGKTTTTYIGSTSNDEMCNFYIMYYMEAENAIPFMNCIQDGNPELFQSIPQEANIPIPVGPDMMMNGHHTGIQELYENPALQQPKREEEEVLDQGFHLEEAVHWPGANLQLGQASGLALDSKNNLVIFHRGDHIWDRNSFDGKYVYQQRGIGPIEESTILVIEPTSGVVLKSTGKNLFYLPHGLTTDKDDNYWVTDVALHQVFKLGADGKEAPLLTLGKAFQPGSDRNHFCQPTDVAVNPATGNFYVSDGYCNSRIIQFSPEGKFLMQWGEETPYRGIAKPGQFRLPHSLVFIPEFETLCVADRENGRIQCFAANTGEFLGEFKHKEFGEEVFAVSYTPENGGLLYTVNGDPEFRQTTAVQAFVMNFTTGEIIDTFSPVTKEFLMPHDIVATEDMVVYVGDVHADTVWKFTPAGKSEHRSVKKAGIEVQEIEAIETVLQTEVKGKPKTTESLKEQKSKNIVQQTSKGVSPVLITTLLVIPIVVLLAIALFIRWRRSRIYGEDKETKMESSSGGILGRLRGKGSSGLNLGNFFASHKGYSRKGFDRLNTEGSDQEKDDEEATDSETEEYTVPAPPPVSSS
ncbi:peptidyl-glycine alpha-amidating monooxygenase isoform X4 [Latimeria chalumnae]|uniref:peptidyl-glycine alpha-amidating monooxygenase isoform X4 n=1 Tax=Latimeria chalumnae TaxID=7897 RepID=UPI00313EA8EF